MDKRNIHLVKNFSIYFIGSFASKVLSFFLLPIYTIYLNLAAFGQIDIYLTFLSIAYSIVSLQAIEVVYRFIQDAETEKEKEIVVTNSLAIALLGIGMFSIGMISVGTVMDFEYTYIFVLYVAFNILAQFCQQFIRGMSCTTLYSAVGVFASVVQFLCNIIFIIICHYGAVSLLLSATITFFTIIIVILLKNNIMRYVRISALNCKIIKEQLAYSIPLMPNAICIWGATAVGRYLLLFFYSTAEVGLFAFATKFSQLLGIVNSIFFMAWQQSAIEEYESKDKNEYATLVFNAFAILQICGIAILIPFCKIAIFTIMGKSYIEAWQFVPIFFLGTMFKSFADFASMGFYGAKKTSTIFWASFFSIIVYILIGIIGAKYYFIMGVGAAYTISQILYFIIMKERAKEYLHIKFCIKQLIMPIALLIVSFIQYYTIHSSIYTLIYMIIFIICGLIINRSLFSKFINIALNKMKGKKS